MPLDPRIPLGVQPPATTSPFEALQTVAQIQDLRERTEARRAAAEEARQKAADQAAIRRVFQETEGDLELAIPRLRQIAPNAALTFEKSLADTRKSVQDALHQQATTKSAQLDLAIKAAQGVTDEPTFQAFRRMVTALDPNMGEIVGTAYDPASMERVIGMGRSAKDRADQQAAGIKQVFGDNPVQGLAQYIAAVPPEEGAAKIAEILDNARQLGVPKAARDLFAGPDYATIIKRANQLKIGAEKQADLAGQAETRAQTAAHQAHAERIAEGQLAVSQGQLGVARAREAREAAGVGAEGVKLTAAQQEDLSTMLTVEKLIGDVEAINKEKGLPGVGPLEGRFFASARGSGGTTGETLRNLIGNIKGTIAKLRGGTAFSAQEQKMLDSYTPTETDRDAIVLTKLTNLADFIRTKRANTLRVAAGQYELPPSTDAGRGGGAPKEGDTKPIPGHPGTEQTYRKGKWIRTK
jgi:hypothetical protein